MEKDDSKICILIVPYTKKVKKLLIPKWLPKLSVAILSILLISASIYIGKVHSLKIESQEYIARADSLEKEGKLKDEKLSQLESQNQVLQAKSDEVENKLNEIDSLQQEVEKLTGAKTPSRGGNISRDMKIGSTCPEEEMEIACEILDNKKLEMENYVADVEKRLDYLETIPDLMPTSGRLTSKFGNRVDPFTRGIRSHSGIDLANSHGTSIKAAGKGRVIFSGFKNSLGNLVIIDHYNRYKTVYAHNSELLVKVGEWVE